MKPITLFSPYIPVSAARKIKEVIKSRWIGQGQIVDDFEQAISNKFEFPSVIAVQTNSAGISLALDLIGVGKGDEVITSSLVCTATTMPILWQHATPVFADIEKKSLNIDPDAIIQKITAKTRAIIVYHWGGYPCNMHKIAQIANLYKIPVIEDASDALGAIYKNNYIGTHSDFVIFSTQPTQILTTGEGGFMVIKNPDWAKRAKIKRWYGIDRLGRTPNTQGYYDFDIKDKGLGYHFTNLQASIGLVQLEIFDKQIKRKRQIASMYSEKLKNVPGLRLIKPPKSSHPSYQLFTILVENRDEFYKMLKNKKIESSIIHERNDKYSVFGEYKTLLTNLDRIENKYMVIPSYASMTDAQVEYVIKTIKNGW